ncbi:MAG: hypothetical protein P8Z78_12770 [Gammaproteobacteria bacterium]
MSVHAALRDLDTRDHETRHVEHGHREIIELHPVANLGQAIQLAENDAADRGHARILHTKMCQAVEIRQFHVSRHDIAVFVPLLVEMLARNRTAEVAKDIAQDSLDGDEAVNTAKLVDHECGLGVAALEEIEHLVDLLGRRRPDRGMQKLIERDFRKIAILVQQRDEILRMQETDDVVPLLAKNREPVVAILAHMLEDIRHRPVCIDEDDARARNHDLDDLRAASRQQVVDEGALCRRDAPLLLRIPHERLELVDPQQVFRRFLLADDHAGDAIGNEANRLANRGDQAHPDHHGACDDARAVSDRIRDSDRFRRHFAKQQQQRHHQDDVDPLGVLRPVEADEDGGHIRGCCDIDEFVTAEYRDNQPARLLEQPVECVGFGMALAAQALEIELGEREERRLRTREESRCQQQKELQKEARQHVRLRQPRRIDGKGIPGLCELCGQFSPCIHWRHLPSRCMMIVRKTSSHHMSCRVTAL